MATQGTASVYTRLAVLTGQITSLRATYCPVVPASRADVRRVAIRGVAQPCLCPENSVPHLGCTLSVPLVMEGSEMLLFVQS